MKPTYTRTLFYSFLATTLLGMLFFCSACVPPSERTYSGVSLDWRDTTFQRIAQLQDQQRAAELVREFRSPDPTARYLAARAFGSLQDSTYADSLLLLMSDPYDDIRAVAAYAIGQQGISRLADSLVSFFVQTDTAGTYRQTNSAILAAVGRAADSSFLAPIATIKTYAKSDTLLLEGQAWGLYYYGLRGIITEEGTRRMATIAADESYPTQVRWVASSYLARSARAIDSIQRNDLIDAFERSRDERIRMNLATVLGKTQADVALQSLQRRYSRENDWRVRTNILKSFAYFPYEVVRDRILEALRDPVPHVALTAADYLVNNGIGQDATRYWQFARDSLPTDVQNRLYQAANRHLPYYFADYRDAINAQIRQRYAAAQSPYQKADLLRALAEFLWNYRYVQEIGFADQSPVVRSAAVAALGQIAADPDYVAFFKQNTGRVNRELAVYFQQAIVSGDVGMVYEAAQGLQSKNRPFRALLDTLDFLDEAQQKLTLPRDVEAYNEIATLRSFLKNEPAPPYQSPKWNHPIDWSLLNGLTDRLTAQVKTSQGTITLRLRPDLAPGTVASFVKLVQDGYYTNKVLHRVVPNFVVQGGGPRGDGFGALDYTLRTEVPPFHWDQRGWVGMASAGRDTEGVQFFITHSPTPHLDGRYTAFAQVIDGQAVVDKLRIGDTIQSVKME